MKFHKLVHAVSNMNPLLIDNHIGAAGLILWPRVPPEPDRPLHLPDGHGQRQRYRGGHEDSHENRCQRGYPQEVEGDEKVRDKIYN